MGMSFFRIALRHSGGTGSPQKTRHPIQSKHSACGGELLQSHCSRHMSRSHNVGRMPEHNGTLHGYPSLSLAQGWQRHMRHGNRSHPPKDRWVQVLLRVNSWSISFGKSTCFSRKPPTFSRQRKASRGFILSVVKIHPGKSAVKMCCMPAYQD